MKYYHSSLCLWLGLLLLSSQPSPINTTCHFKRSFKVHCDDLRDIKNILIHNLRSIRTSSSGETLNPGTFANFSGLSYLDLSKGKLQKIRSGSFKELQNLVTLNLSNNKLKALETGAFVGLKELVSLEMKDNVLSQIPPNLTALQKLKFLDMSGNPLNCNCAMLKIRDSLVNQGLKFSGKTTCSDPFVVKDTPVIKLDTQKTCQFENQDREMQNDAPDITVEGSGDVPADNEIEPIEVSHTTVSEEITTESVKKEVPEVPVEVSLSSAETSMSSFETSTETMIVTMEPMSKSSTELPETSSSESIAVITTTTIPIEGSGDVSAIKQESSEIVEGSGAMVEDVIIDTTEPPTTTTEPPTTTTAPSTTTLASTTGSTGLVSLFFNIFSSPYNTAPLAPTTPATTTTTITTETTTTTTMSTPTTDRMTEITNEHFIPVTESTTMRNEILVKKMTALEPGSEITGSERQPKSFQARSPSEDKADKIEPETAKAWLAKRGMGSYVVLCLIFAFVILLIALAAYRGNVCSSSNRKHRDPERGTELKDMTDQKKSLLDSKSSKIQIANGGKMENVPLMINSTVASQSNGNCRQQPDDSRDSQRSYDIAVTNDSNSELMDPVKPPRKLNLADFDQLSVNGKYTGIEDLVDSPTMNGCNGDHAKLSPSPGAQKVKITLQELPNSVPMTPIVITRLQNDGSLVNMQ